MKLTFPDYCKKFTCIADKCTDTCCNGWDVVIDGESLEYYRNLSTDYGKKIRSLITVDEDGDSIFVSEKGRCPFLLDNGLCDMYINLGHSCLSRTCRIFPRFTNSFGFRAEKGLFLSCPEAARLIFESREPVTFITEDAQDDMVPADFDNELYFTLLDVRKTAINILQNRKFSAAERLCAFLRHSELVQEFINLFEYEGAENICADIFFEKKTEYSSARAKRALKGIFKFFGSMEFINSDYPSVLSAAEAAHMQGFTADDILIEHLAVYFVHRYFITAAYDGRLLEKAIFAVVCTIVIMRISALGNGDFQTAAQKFSKEIEHSALNMEILVKAIGKSRCFSTENIINILSEKEK
ncbi:MAG: hypothetical protein E7516_07130 [Ruminococcaceae bacterium]|nr:hypothetical protein [Oscillospiraceae bacterium]